MQLGRAGPQSELDDTTGSGQFRPNPDGFTFVKWFALRHESAAAWGVGLQTEMDAGTMSLGLLFLRYLHQHCPWFRTWTISERQ